MPANFRFVLTSRPDDMLNELRQRHGEWLKEHVIDLLVHDFRLLSSPDAPERFVWTIRPCGTTLFFPDAGTGRDFLHFMRISTSSMAFTFDGDKLEPVFNPDYAAQFLEDREAQAA